MASAAEPAEDLLKCSICFEVFKKPKYLPCLHTFCESCLHTYITSLSQKEQKLTGFNCPVCRAHVPGPEGKKAKKWAKNFPANHLIVSLIDHKGKDSGKACDECLREKVDDKAEFLCLECSEVLCSMCSKYHRRNKSSMNHQILKLDELTDETLPILTTPKMYCKEHAERKLEVYCVDHDLPCCFLCMSLYHRKCDQIISFEEASNDIRENKAPQLTKEVVKTCKSLTTMAEIKQQNIAEIDIQCSDIKKEMSLLKKELVDHIDELERTKIKELDKLYELHVSKMKSEEENCKMRSLELASCEKLLTSCISHGSNAHILLEYNRIKNRHQEVSKEIENRISNTSKVGIMFDANKYTKAIQTFNSFGSLTVCDFQKANPVLVSTIELPNERGALGCDFTNDGIIFTDFERPRCFIYNMARALLIEIKLPGNSYDVAAIDSKEAVITLRWKKMIQYIDTEKMILSRTVHLAFECMGICKYKDMLVVAFGNCLVVFDLNFQVIRKIELSNYSCDRLVCTTKDKILYTDRTDNSVHCIDEYGTEMFCYTDDALASPLGISADYQGNIYVAGWHSGNIHQITSTGNQCRILFADIQEPWRLKFKKNSKTLIVTFELGKKANIYRLE